MSIVQGTNESRKEYILRGATCKIGAVELEPLNDRDFFQPVPVGSLRCVILTKDILKNNLGFDVHDMGDFWQFERNGFVLIQAKMAMAPEVEMPFTFGFKTTTSKTRKFTEVHKLQNFYYEIQEEELEWIP